jgi:hypothetical protein
MSAIVYDLASPIDDPALRHLLRMNPLDGNITLTLQCEPDYFAAAGVEGEFHQTPVARDSLTGKVVGMGSRSVRLLWINGEPQPVGYMSHLRVDPNRQWGLSMPHLVRGAFNFYHQLHADGQTPFYLVSITDGNQAARRLLTSGRKPLPKLHPLGRFDIFAIAPTLPRYRLPLPRGLRLAFGKECSTFELLDCLARSGADGQFAPVWTLGSLFTQRFTPGLKKKDFIVALDGKRVVGCIARWDQTAFKQTRVRGYSGGLGRWRGLINWIAPHLGYPRLPAPGQTIFHSYASHLAVDNNNPDIFRALLRALYLRCQTAGDDYFVLGLSERHPLRKIVRHYPHVKYRSQHYLAAWEDDAALNAALIGFDQRVPNPEAAVL